MNIVFDSDKQNYRCHYCGEFFYPLDERIVTGNGEISSVTDLWIEHRDCYENWDTPEGRLEAYRKHNWLKKN